MPVPQAIFCAPPWDGRVHVTLSLSNLAVSPKSAEASVTITVADGSSQTFLPVREPVLRAKCETEETGTPCVSPQLDPPLPALGE